MRYVLVMPGIGSKEWATRADAETALETARAIGVSDAWIATAPDDDELDGSAGEGCSQ